MKAVRFDISHY